jgi:hypothetical protein
MLSVAKISLYAECHYSEGLYAECRGAKILTESKKNRKKICQTKNLFKTSEPYFLKSVACAVKIII